MLNRVLTSVDLPRPDSPVVPTLETLASPKCKVTIPLTDNHHVEVEALANALAVPLVGKVGETDVTSELATDDVAEVARRGSCYASQMNTPMRAGGSHCDIPEGAEAMAGLEGAGEAAGEAAEAASEAANHKQCQQGSQLSVC